MGKFLNQVLTISVESTGKQKAISIIKEINQKIKQFAKDGYTEIYLTTYSGDGVVCLSSTNKTYTKNIYFIKSKYVYNSEIFNHIIKYYKDEGFSISEDDNYMISWKEKLNEYLLSYEEK